MKSIRTTRSAAITLGVMAVLVSGAFTAVAAQAAPRALKAALSLSAKSTTVGKAITASAAKSSVPKGDKLTKITLNWGDGSKAVVLSGLKAKASHRYPKPGRFTVRLTLTDRHKKTAQATAPEQVVAAPPPAGSYTGSTAQNIGLTFYVSSNRASLQDIAIPTVFLNCTPGGTTANSELSIAAAAITSSRSFKGAATQSGVWQGFPAKFTYKFSGSFTTVNSAASSRQRVPSQKPSAITTGPLIPVAPTSSPGPLLGTPSQPRAPRGRSRAATPARRRRTSA